MAAVNANPAGLTDARRRELDSWLVEFDRGWRFYVLRLPARAIAPSAIAVRASAAITSGQSSGV